MSNLKITKNWFYKLSEINESELNVNDNLDITIFDDWSISRNIRIWENTKLSMYWLIENKDNHKIEFIQDKKWSVLSVNYLLLSKDKISVKSKIHSKVVSDDSSSDVKIISLVWKDWFIDLDWIIEIWKNFKKIKGHLVEENIFLWETWRIRGLPTLLVWSNDVEASHACKIEKISDEELFYLRSRGIWRGNALKVLLEAKIDDLFWWLENIEKDFYWKIREDILEKI